MKKLNFTFLFTMLMSMVGLNASAHDIAVKNDDGVTIYYSYIYGTKLEVTYRGSSFSSYSNEYTGNVVIPKYVTFNNKTYSVTSIGNDAFSDCYRLTSITIPNSVTSIGNDAFSDCYRLTSVTINSNAILSKAYTSSSNLSNIFGIQVKQYIIGNSVTSIGESAFYNCSGLTSVTIPNSVKNIGNLAFYGCSGLTSVTIPNSVTSIGESAFSGCSGLTSVTLHCNDVGTWFNGLTSIKEVVIGSEVTSIGYKAFYYCSGLTSVTIGSGVTSIGESAFYNCSGLTSVTIPNSVKNIGSYAFSKCLGLTSVTIPNSVKSIGGGAFWGCSGLKSVTIPNSVKSIGSSAFWGCSGLTSVTIPNSVTSIEDDAFRDCSGLTSINIPNGVTSIGRAAFFNCSGLTSIEIPNSVTSIGTGAFYGCSGLTSIEIPNSVTSIGSQAFEYCTGLTSVTIGSGVTSIGESAFDGCSGLTSVTWNAKKCTGFSSYNYAPFYGIKTQITEFNFGDEVETIPDYLCYGMTGLTSITIPNSVTSIGSYAFYKCLGLTSVTIPNSVTSIGEYAFSGCSKLTLVESRIGNVFGIADNTFSSETYNAELRVPQGLSSIYKQATGWKKFKSITEGNDGVCGNNLTYTYSEASGKLTIQGTGAMYDYSSSPAPWNSYKGDIITIVIEDGATSVGSYAFSGCSKLTSVTIPNSVTSIGKRAFDGCSGLTSVTINSDAILSKTYTSSSNLSNIFGSQVKQYIIGNSVTSIGNSAFYWCSGLKSVTIPNSVKSIGELAFCGCDGLTSVIIPNSVTSIGNYAFYDCSGLTSITIPNSVTSIGNTAFSRCSGLTSITIPNSVTSIGESAFSGCSGLTSITIPNSVTSIGDYAFRYSGLTSVTIGSGVTSIGSSAFEFCSGLTSVTWNAKKCTGFSSYTYNYAPFYGIKTQITEFNFGDEVETIPDYLCYGMTGLTSITIPNSVTSIGSSAFDGCSGLTSITIPNSVTSIGSSAFSGCKGLKKVIVPDIAAWCGINFGSADANPLYNVHHLYSDKSTEVTELVIPDGVTSIGSYAFYNCSGLTSITIPNSVKSIGNYAFQNCSGLTSITIPNSVTSIGSYAFYKCLGLTSVTIPNSVTSIGNSAFSGCSGLTSVTINSDAILSKTYTSSSNLSNIFGSQVKQYIIGNSVTSIGSYAFYKCLGLTSVTIGSGVTSIRDYAFSGCSSLTLVESRISKVFGIYDNTFSSETYNNAELRVPRDLSSKYKQASGWDNFKSITEGNVGVCGNNLTYTYSEVSGKLTIQGTGAMYDYSSSSPAPWNSYKGDIITIVIEDGATSVGSYAFYGCSNLYSVTFGKDVKTVRSSAFENCSALKKVIAPDIAAWCGISFVSSPNSQYNQYSNPLFYAHHLYSDKSTEITELVIPEGVTSIGAYAFEYCSGLTSITIPNSVKSIGEYAFDGCSGLTSVTFHCNNVGTWFSGMSSIKEVWIEKEVTSIGEESFAGCSGLQSVYNNAEDAFIIAKNTFDDATYSSAKLYVPTGMKATYEDTPWWANFNKKEEYDFTTPEPSSDNALAISNAETYAGQQIVLPIDMNNAASIKAFQFDLYLPEGVTVAKGDENEDMIDLTSRATKSHSISAQTRPDGAIRMICTSMAGAAFKGNEGTIVNVTLSVAPDMTAGNYEIKIKNIELSDGTPYNPADIKATLTVKAYTPGDVDGTGTVSVNDAVCIINYILGSPIEGFIEAAADLDGNGVITVNDVVILINDYILGGNSQNSLDLAFLEDVTADDDCLFINDITMKAGETTEVEVFMNTNRNDIQGLQCDIYLPEGMEFVPEEDGDEKYYADKGGRAAKSHSVAAKLRADGSVRVVETSTSGAKFKDNDQAVFYFTVKAKEDMVAGNYEIKLANMELSYGGTPINPSDRTAKVVITVPSAINGVNAKDAESFVGKIIKDNRIIIMKNGKKHSVSGQGM